jgi:ATP-dependent exoDNAse (exonuclease V) beta subunit
MPKSKAKKALPTPYDYLKSLEKERADFEDARVLYVAVTRAERCLHLLGAVSLDKDGAAKPKKNTFLEMLWPVVFEHFKPENLQAENLGAGASSANKPSLSLEEFVPQLLRLEATAIPQSLMADVVINPQPSKQNAAESSIAPVLETDIGTLAHRYLELIAKANAAWPISRLDGLKSAMQRWLVQQGHIASRANEGAERVIELLKITLQSESGVWVLQARESAQSELQVEFVEGDAVKKRVIDRTFIEAGTRWIVDYKTTRLDANADDESVRNAAEQYRQQLTEYAALFADEGLPMKLAVYFLSIGRLIEL